MKVELKEHICTVTREPGDPKMRDGGFGTAESRLLHHVKKVLNARGFDLVKRRTQSDGHMYGWERTVYLRDRKWRFCIVDGNWALNDNAAAEFNRKGEAVLLVERWEGLPEGRR